MRYRRKNPERYKRLHSEAAKRRRREEPEKYLAIARAASKKWQAKNPARKIWNAVRFSARKHGYEPLRGTYAEFEEWLYTQVAKAHGRCQWCNEPFAKIREPSIDHDHVTGEPRALVCRPCNNIEGFARSPEHLEMVAKAMRKFRRLKVAS